MYGNFVKDTAGYTMDTFDLPASWEYIYENKNVLLKVDQYGPVYAQANPPGDIMLFKREQHQKYAPWFINIITDSEKRVSNFLRPCNPKIEPEKAEITYLPECATYSFAFDGLRITTEIFIPNEGIQIVYKFKVTNIGKDKRTIQICPQLIPYLNDAVIAPWDKYDWYLDTNCNKDSFIHISTKLLNANGEKAKRRCASFVSDAKDLVSHELSLEKYVGFGDPMNPDGHYSNADRIYAYPPVYALRYEWTLSENEEKELTQVLSLDGEDGIAYFDNKYYLEKKAERKRTFDKLFSINRVKTGDELFDYYANYWLPLQMNWVASLDRGWPTGMRGSRDSSQDYTALLYIDTASARKLLLTMLECQRSDGWFPRQYSSKGKYGKHDLRGHVDGGAFFIEFIWKYLAHTHDYAVLNEKVQWLDLNVENTVLEHVIQAVEYYICEENIGEHGLCKIREGDWLDAVNRAGMEGRGESVTVTEQMVMGLYYLSDILRHIHYEGDIRKYDRAADQFKDNLNKNAFNGEFYNGCFNDNGQWIFSDKDPDGEERAYSVSNYYAAISGVAPDEYYINIWRVAERLKSDKGYRLFYPPLGVTPIDKVGRVASGDVPPFMGENANVYNHGSQGFLARALSVMGMKEQLWEVLRWIMPFDQQKHPTEKVLTPPYAIVNCYQQLPGFDHRGLMCFLTGSVAMAMRGVYEWLLGIKPSLDGLEISPCIDNAQAEFEYLGKKYSLRIQDEKIYLNGKQLTEKRDNLITKKPVFYMEIEA